MKFTPNLVVGVVLTLVGGVLVLDRLGLVEFQQALRLWPVMLVLFGISVIVDALRDDPDAATARYRRPIVGPGFVLVLVVVTVLVTRADQQRFVASGAPADPEMSLVAVMGRDDRVVLSPAFRKAQMTTVMGRTQLDLRRATLATDGEATVDVFGLMGGVEVYVPADWVVDIRAVAVMGASKDERRSADRRRREAGSEVPASPPAAAPPASAGLPDADAASPAPPRLVIRGTVLMGALVIKS